MQGIFLVAEKMRLGKIGEFPVAVPRLSRLFLLCTPTHTPVQSGAFRAKRRQRNLTSTQPKAYALQALARNMPTGVANSPTRAEALQRKTNPDAGEVVRNSSSGFSI